MANKIGWCDETWNPVVGCTAHCKDPNGQEYCYARRQAKRRGPFCQQPSPDVLTSDTDCAQFWPHLHEERLGQPLGWRKPRRIFCGSMCDLWDPEVKREWRMKIFDVMAACPQHRFMVLTKRPERITAVDIAAMRNLEHLYVGTTVESSWYEYRQRHVPMRAFVSAEPFFERFEIGAGITWLILGKDSRRGEHRYLPVGEEFLCMIVQADRLRIPVYLKGDLAAGLGLPERREFPEGLKLESDNL